MGAMMGPGARPIKVRGTLALALGAVAAAAAPAGAEAPRAVPRLIAGIEAEGGGRVAGLEIALAEGWKTYWRAPGDAGVPPLFDWSGSANLASVEVLWPAPAVFDSFGFATLGYAGRALLPLRVTPADPAVPVALRLALDYGVCAEICIPERAELALDIAPGEAPDGAEAVAAALARLPTPGAQAGVAPATCGLSGAGTERAFAARLTLSGAPPAAPYAVVEGPEGVWFGPAEVAREGDALVVAAEAQLSDPALWVARGALRLTLIGAGWGAAGAVEIDGCAG